MMNKLKDAGVLFSLLMHNLEISNKDNVFMFTLLEL